MFYLPGYLAIIHLSSINTYFSVYLSIYVSIYLSIYPSIYLSTEGSSHRGPQTEALKSQEAVLSQSWRPGV